MANSSEFGPKDTGLSLITRTANRFNAEKLAVPVPGITIVPIVGKADTDTDADAPLAKNVSVAPPFVSVPKVKTKFPEGGTGVTAFVVMVATGLYAK